MRLKQLIRPVRGFKTPKTNYAAIKGLEVMCALREGQAPAFNITRDIRGEAGVRPSMGPAADACDTAVVKASF